jgi:hypothetical protein
LIHPISLPDIAPISHAPVISLFFPSLVTKLKSKGRARTQIAKQRKLRATKITRMAQQRHHENPFQHFFPSHVFEQKATFLSLNHISPGQIELIIWVHKSAREQKV